MSTKAVKHIPNKVKRKRRIAEAKEAYKESGEARAIAKYLKISPRKARLVADAIRGKATGEAMNFLRFSAVKPAKYVLKVVESAIANAENNFMLDSEDLYIHRVYVDEGPVMKRFRARAMGRAVPIRRRTSHVTVVVKQRGEGK